jgi:hypothetical protein
VWPERRLKDYERRDSMRFASQIMNNPAISTLNPITRDQCLQCLIPRDQVPWGALRYAILCDTAFWDGYQRINKAETVYEVWGYPRNGSGDVYYVEGYGSPTWRAEDFANRLVSIVQRYRSQNRTIFAISDEDPKGGKRGSWTLSLKNRFNDANERMPRLIELERNRAQTTGVQGANEKTRRMVAAASFWSDGKVRLVEGAPGVDRLIEQMTKIGQYQINHRIRIDWADAAADVFSPELYQPMRLPEKKAPWETGAQPIQTEGIDWEEFRDADLVMPRPPIT